MKKVWSTPSLVQADLVRSILEAEGISCVLRNEDAARFPGVGMPTLSGQALGFAWVELWVPEEQLPDAHVLVQEFSEGHEETLTAGED